MLDWVGIKPDESMKVGGEYGPYLQTERIDKHKTIEKQFLKSNMAYPCFCDPDSHEGPYDGKCRSLSFEEIKKRIQAGEPYAVRIKSDLIPLPETFRDEVWGDL